MRAILLVIMTIALTSCGGGGGSASSHNSGQETSPVTPPAPVVTPDPAPVQEDSIQEDEHPPDPSQLPASPPTSDDEPAETTPVIPIPVPVPNPDPEPVEPDPEPVEPPVVPPVVKTWTVRGIAEFYASTRHPAVAMAQQDDEGKLIGIVYAEPISMSTDETATTSLAFSLVIGQDQIGTFHLVSFNDANEDGVFDQIELVGDWECQLRIADGKIVVVDPFGDVVTGGEDATKYGSIFVAAQYEQR